MPAMMAAVYDEEMTRRHARFIKAIALHNGVIESG
jgi:hypothetical protein